MSSLKRNPDMAPAIKAQPIAASVAHIGRTPTWTSRLHAASQEVRKVSTNAGKPKSAAVASE
jgi:hypothetical protein